VKPRRRWFVFVAQTKFAKTGGVSPAQKKKNYSHQHSAL
jgi:hypothetical protein